MKVKAITTLTCNQASRLYDRLAWVVAQASWDTEYCVPSCQISNNGDFAVVGKSCNNNFCRVDFDAATSTLHLEIDARRHALKDSGNCAGMVFTLFYHTPEMVRGVVMSFEDLELLHQLQILEYKSMRKDRHFWESGLSASQDMDRKRSILSRYFKQWRPEYWVAYNPETQSLAAYHRHYNIDAGPNGVPVSAVLDGVDYRRLATEGITI